MSQSNVKLPVAAKVVAAYFAVASVCKLAVNAYEGFGPASSMTAGAAAGTLTAHFLFQLPALVAAIGIALRRLWGTWLGALVLLGTTFTMISGFERGAMLALDSSTQPGLADRVWLIAAGVSVAWHGLWAVLLYRGRPEHRSLGPNNSSKPTPLRGAA